MSQDDKSNTDAQSAEAPAEIKPEPLPSINAKGVSQPKATHVVKTFTHGGPLLAARFDPLGKYIFAAGQDFRITRFAFEDGQKTDLPGEHGSWVRGLAFTPDGTTMLSGGYDGQLIWWPTANENPTPIRKISAHDGWVRAVAVSPDGKFVATCGNDNLVRLWDVASGERVLELSGHQRHVYNVAFHPNATALVSNDLMGNFKHWDVGSGKLVREFRQAEMHKYDTTFRADIGGARGMAFDREGKWLAASGITEVSNAFAGVGKPTVELIDWTSGQRVQRYVQGGKGIAWGVTLHADHFVVATFGDSLLFWPLTEAKLHHQAKIGSLAFDLAPHPDGVHLATAHHDGKVRISKMAAKSDES